MGDGEERESIKGDNVSHSERTMGRQKVRTLACQPRRGTNEI